MDRITGSIRAIAHRTEASGYTVLDVEQDGAMVRVVAFLPSMPREGERFAAEGAWQNHARYGRQFRATAIEILAPAARSELIAFLASGLFPGVGEGTAKNIVAEFGEHTLDILDRHAELLYRVPGMGRAKVEAFLAAWKEHRAWRDLALFLGTHGFSVSFSAKVYKAWGGEALARAKTEPFAVYSTFSGATFALVDAMATALGFAPSCRPRCEAGILEAMSRSYGDGHTCLPRAQLLAATTELLEIEVAPIEAALANMLAMSDLYEESWNDTKVVFTPGMRRCEIVIAEQVAALSNQRALLSKFSRTDVVHELARRRRLSLSPSQHLALQSVLGSPVSVLTGGPGTGKTRLTQIVCDAASAAGVPIHLAAPTGRAAKRLSDLTGMDAYTLHRLLCYNPGLEKFERNADSPLPKGLVLVDESSMIDVPLAANLMKAIPPGSQLVFVGDIDQLPSVGPGTVLSDIIAALPASMARLTEIHRQSKKSMITRNAHGLLRGHPLEIPVKGQPSDFFFVRADSPEDVCRRLKQVMQRLLEKGHDLRTEVQVIAPTRKGDLGTIAINKLLRAIVNPAPEGAPTAHGLHVGDKVVQTRNDYEREVFNGNIGTIERIDEEQKLAWLTFDGQSIEYTFADLDAVELANALTTHKSQGSEYPIVVALVHRLHGPLLSRPLLYTAITRARKVLVLIGESAALDTACRAATQRARHGCLAARLHASLNPAATAVGF